MVPMNLTKARVQLQKENPFFAYLAMHLRLEEDSKAKTCKINREGRLKFNPKWISSLTSEECKGLMAHEILHNVFGHITRRGSRKKAKFDIACDLVVNNLLVNEGLELPMNYLLPKDNIWELGSNHIDGLDRKTAEQVYEELEIEEADHECGGSCGLGFDEHEYQDESEPGDCAGQGEVWKKMLRGAAKFAKDHGGLSANMERLVSSISAERLNWRALLQSYITLLMPADYTYARPSKKALSLGIFLPGLVKEKLQIVAAIDTSGSITREDLDDFTGELKAILRSFQNVEVTAITCDAAIQDIYSLTTKGGVDIGLKGGGGTDFRPVFEHVEKEMPNTRLIVYFTDGCGDYPLYSDIPTLWVMKSLEKAPFGETVRYEN